MVAVQQAERAISFIAKLLWRSSAPTRKLNEGRCIAVTAGLSDGGVLETLCSFAVMAGTWYLAMWRSWLACQ